MFVCLFDYQFFFFLYICDTGNVLCTYIRLDPSITQWQRRKASTKKKKKKKSDHILFFLPKGHSIQSKKCDFLLLQSTNPFSSFSLSLSLSIVRCTCCVRTHTQIKKKEKLSCHRLYTHREREQLLDRRSIGRRQI
jgi:hypothetical protein